MIRRSFLASPFSGGLTGRRRTAQHNQHVVLISTLISSSSFPYCGGTLFLSSRPPVPVVVDSNDDDDDGNEKKKNHRHTSSRSTIQSRSLSSSSSLVGCLPRRRMGTYSLESTTITTTTTVVHHMQPQQQRQQLRLYHATSKQEILPLVALVVAGVTVRYGYKALVRMDEEWQEYEDLMKNYRRQQHGDDVDFDEHSHNFDGNEGRRVVSSHDHHAVFKDGVLGIDLGSVNVRIAHGGGKKKARRAEVVVDREGHRFTPNCILWDDGGGDGVDDDEMLLGRLASGKIWERSTREGMISQVQNARQLLLLRSEKGEDDDDDDNEQQQRQHNRAAVQAVIRSAASNALEQILGSSTTTTTTTSSSRGNIFSVDVALSGGYNVRPVFTYPPPPSHTGTHYKVNYEKAMSTLTAPAGVGTFVLEPVAAITGAEQMNLLPLNETNNGPILVIDVGGEITSMSLVSPKAKAGTEKEEEERIIQSISIPFGGQTLISTLVSYLIQSFFNTRPNERPDGMALQRLNDAAYGAIVELSYKTRSQISIPYLTVDENMQPRHLDVGVGRTVLEEKLNEYVRDTLTNTLNNEDDDGEKVVVLSSSMPPPTNLTTLFTSIVMNLLVSSNQSPYNLHCVLIVGGGARSPIVVNALKQALTNLAGEQFVLDGEGGDDGKKKNRVVIPEGELVEEMVVLGAAVASSAPKT